MVWEMKQKISTDTPSQRILTAGGENILVGGNGQEILIWSIAVSGWVNKEKSDDIWVNKQKVAG